MTTDEEDYMPEILPIEGRHCAMSEEEAHRLYEELKEIHSIHLKEYGVHMPPNEKTKKAMQLVFLYKHRGKLVHKDSIGIFVSTILEVPKSDQQARHLSTQYGWNILNRYETIPHTNGEKVPNGYHMFMDPFLPKEGFAKRNDRRKNRLEATTFRDLVDIYNNRCVTCGAEEGKEHPIFSDQTVLLQMGHMDPRLPLDLDNVIPQCQLCNQQSKDDFIYDEYGRVKAIHNESFIMRSDDETKQKMLHILLDYFDI